MGTSVGPPRRMALGAITLGILIVVGSVIVALVDSIRWNPVGSTQEQGVEAPAWEIVLPVFVLGVGLTVWGFTQRRKGRRDKQNPQP